MAQARMPEKKKRNLKENHGSNLASERQNRGETFDICRKKSIGQKNDLCALLAGIGHTVKITMFALEKSKSRKVEKFTCQEISARKVEKIEKIEKSKNRKVEKFEKFEKSIFFWFFDFFAKIFLGRVINPVGFGGIGAQAVSTHRVFYGCLVALSRSHGWLLSRGAGNLQSVYQN